MSDTLHVYLGIGSNLGDRASNLQRAVSRLGATPGLTLTAASRVYSSPAWGYQSNRSYYNAVLELSWDGPPLDLAEQCYRIEAAGGRHMSGSSHEDGYRDRTIDIDLLWIDGMESSSGRLTLPHPRAHQRGFVLKPWQELAPGLVLLGRPLAEWIAELPPDELATTKPVESVILTIELAQ